MKRKYKKLWLAALRSGKYSQCQNALHNTNEGGYCCLGVLANELGALEYTGYNGNIGIDAAHMGSLPDEMLDNLKLRSYHQNVLVNMNDVKNKSFSEIADWIEKHV